MAYTRVRLATVAARYSWDCVLASPKYQDCRMPNPAALVDVLPPPVSFDTCRRQCSAAKPWPPCNRAS